MKTIILKSALAVLLVFALITGSRAAGNGTTSNAGVYSAVSNPQDSVLTITAYEAHPSRPGQPIGEIWVSGASMDDVDFDIYMDGNYLASSRTGNIYTIGNLSAGTYDITITGPNNSDSESVTIVDSDMQ